MRLKVSHKWTAWSGGQNPPGMLVQGLLSDCACVSISSAVVPAVRLCPPSSPLTSLSVSSQKTIWPTLHLIQWLPFPDTYLILSPERCVFPLCSHGFLRLIITYFLTTLSRSIYLSAFLPGLPAVSVQNFLLSLYSVDQEDIKFVKQPNAFIWGLRDGHPGGHKVDWPRKRALNFKQSMQDYKDKTHKVAQLVFKELGLVWKELDCLTHHWQFCGEMWHDLQISPELERKMNSTRWWSCNGQKSKMFWCSKNWNRRHTQVLLPLYALTLFWMTLLATFAALGNLGSQLLMPAQRFATS